MLHLCFHAGRATQWPSQWPTPYATMATMTPMTSTYEPDDEATRLYARYKRARDTEAELKDPVRQQAEKDLRAGATVGQLAKLTGLTPEYFRRIARTIGVERKRPPTVGKLAAATELPGRPAPASMRDVLINRLDSQQLQNLADRAFAHATRDQYEPISAASDRGPRAIVEAALDTGALSEADLF